MTTSLARVANTVLPALSSLGVTYNANHNIFLTQGYTSVAGNTYYQGIRLSDRIIVKLELGQGYYYTFLNGIQVYGYNGNEKRLIGSRQYHCYVYSESKAKCEAMDIVADFVKSQAKMLGESIDASQIREFSEHLVEATYLQTKMLAG